MASIFALGSNGSGQLGIGHKEDVSVPKNVLINGSTLSLGAVQIRAGGNHALLCASSGELYCSGDFSSGACGLSPSINNSYPQFNPVQYNRDEALSSDSKVSYCAATWESSVIVKQDSEGHANQIYTFGTGTKGELGLGELIFKTTSAQLIKDFPPSGTEIVDLAACVGHVVAVLNNGEVYGWGNGRKGQLGKPEGIVYSPRRVIGNTFNVTRAVCGREFTYLLGNSAKNEHCILGADKWGIKSSAPARIEGWKDVGASWNSIFLLSKDHKLLSWGRADHGQLTPTGLPDVSRMAVGSEHALALSTAGDVLAWGWGEHGNCGPATTNGDVKDRWNVVASSQHIPTNSKIISIGAGCASSWICIGPQ